MLFRTVKRRKIVNYRAGYKKSDDVKLSALLSLIRPPQSLNSNMDVVTKVLNATTTYSNVYTNASWLLLSYTRSFCRLLP